MDNKSEESGMVQQKLRNVWIAGTGSYLPERIMTNAELEEMVDTTDEWIVTRTGIRERRIARDDEATSDLAAEAAKNALADAGVSPEEVDVILVATLTPDVPFPNTACFVQEKIGAKNACCFSMEAACSGYLFAVETGRNYIASGAADTVLVIGAEKMSSIADWDDRATCVLFGDGAGACVLKASDDEVGLMGSVMGSDGSLWELLHIPAGGSRMPTTAETVDQRLHCLRMQGREVYKNAVTRMTEAAFAVLDKTGLTVHDVACIIPHQANIRIIRAVGQRLGLPEERFFVNLDKYGNTSAASSAIALDEAVRQGSIKKGDLVLIFVFGGGFTWGASVLRWLK